MTSLPITITPTPPTSIKLESGQQGKFSFTVTSLAAPDRVLDVILQALVVSEDGKEKEADWLLVGPQATLTLSGGKTETVVITVLQKPSTPIGKSTIKLKVADKSIPNDSFTDSSPVVCEVPGAPPKPPGGLPKWLIPVIVAGVLVLAGGGVLAWKLLSSHPLPKLGEACGSDPAHACDTNLVCVTAVNKCLSPAGATCQADHPDLCASGECESPSNVCAIPLGGACTPDDKTKVCPQHASCDPTSKTCTSLPKLGEACGGDAAHACDAGLVCATETKKCSLPGGATCTTDHAGQCASGECTATGCAIPLGSACSPDDKTKVCPKQSHCDPTSKTCVHEIPACTPGAQQCNADGTGVSSCGDDGKFAAPTPCPKGTLCRDGKCQCAAGVGQACGQCGGKTQCDGSCSVPTPANFGQACGHCGGKFQCNGTCSIPDPANFDQPCGNCGGKFLCDGKCSIPNPANFGMACGHCGGTFRCDGSCSVSTPANFGQACGECGGTIQCNGACTNTTPRCPSGFIVDTTAANQCRSTAETVVYNQPFLVPPMPFGTSNINQTITIACGAGRVRWSFDITRTGGTGTCSMAWANANQSDCSVIVHGSAPPLQTAVCNVTVKAVVRQPQCKATFTINKTTIDKTILNPRVIK